MLNKLIDRLQTLGYTYNAETDSLLLTYLTDSVEKQIKNRINRSEIPADLEKVYIDMVCGEFLNQKKASGQLTTYEFEQIVQSIKEGDTTVTFQNGSSPEQQFDALVSSLVNSHEEDFIRFRKLVW